MTASFEVGAQRHGVPAVEGFFDPDADPPALMGSHCPACGTYTFPRAVHGCPNPACSQGELDTVPLSTRGRIWSYTDARYQPPPPYVAADPYVPFAIAAVELEREQLVVMGQVVPGVRVEQLHIGDEVELVVDTLHEDDEQRYVVWKWRPVAHGEGVPSA